MKPTLDRSFLLRLWRADRTNAGGVRASLEDPDTGERTGFASMEELVVFLMELSENEGKGEANGPTTCCQSR